ncbi:MAG: PDZ domain-containing protein, partial [Brevundimonas diminuta]
LPDGRQVSVGVGETISEGLTLASVGADFVTVSRGGSVSRLVFTETPSGAPPPPPPPSTAQVMAPPGGAPAPVSAASPAAAAPTGPVVDPKRLMAQASLRPRMDGLRIKGFTLAARGDGAALRAAGLQSGDVILAVNGTELNSLQGLSQLSGELSGSSAAEIRFERNGQVQTTTIRTGS